jgi:DNA-binding response OmpR family regulator
MDAPAPIVVMDPSSEVVEIARHALEPEEYDAHATTDVAEGLGLVRVRAPKLVIVGAGFEGPSTLEIIQGIARDPTCAGMKVAAFYDLGDDDDAALLLRNGACATLPRPFTDEAFRLWVAGILWIAPELLESHY